MPGILHIIIQTIKFYKKPVLYQFLITALLSAIITGSLLTGRSVRQSLRNSASERIGNTGILISSGTRYFEQELVKRISDNTDIICTGILEMNGFCQLLNSQKVALSTRIFGVNEDFFIFHGHKAIDINHGEVAVNRELADWLGINSGDELIIRYKEISAIPSDAPFATAGGVGKSLVMKVGNILEPTLTGNFSLSISQITPMNIFMNLQEMEDNKDSTFKINRLLIKRSSDHSLSEIKEVFSNYLKPSDIGLRFRMIKKTGENELISDRVFIDESIINEITNKLPAAAPVMTYLGNRFEAAGRSTPYSFVSALPSSLYPEITAGNGIMINSWMSHDLSVDKGDTVKMSWYSPDSLNKLIEKSSDFIVKRIVDMQGIWSDSLLMPDFPGISGKESCSDWDAGVPVDIHDIREKDEEYWNRYRGTPKAFISYEKGKELWGNNFGRATAIRFPAGVTEKDIVNKLDKSIDPERMGFSITDPLGESVEAANESVDFGTLFLSLGFFFIFASMVLLSFTVSSYFDSKRKHIDTLFSIGFNGRWIARLLYLEAGLTGLTGCLTGAFAGYLVNIIITGALNSVWYGAVQTDTLDAHFDIMPVISGFILTFLTIMIMMLIKVKLYLKGLNQKEKKNHSAPSPLRNLFLLFTSAIATISLYGLSVLFPDQKLLLVFAAGTVLLLTLVLFWRQYYIGRYDKSTDMIKVRKQLSHLYYSFHPSNAVTPILFIAAGIFTVFITGANRVNFNDKQMNRSGGTGGYLLWCENAIPVKQDMNTSSGRLAMGLDNDQLSDMSFVQMKRSSGNDASCLNLNHITAPPLLGIDPFDFIEKKSFSFSKILNKKSIENPWQYLNIPSEKNVIFGIADQTVLDWGLKLKPGDTLVLRAENGAALKIVIAAGLKSSIFQGNVLIGMENLIKYYPSVSGSSVMLVDGKSNMTELYNSTLNERFESYGMHVEKTTDRLASFYKVTNTYLSVFGVFGAMGMIIGIAGLGFVLLRNYNQRKFEYALLLATGFHVRKIRSMMLSEQILILFAGVSSGTISALAATLPSITNSHDIPWWSMALIIVAIMITGLSALFLSVRSVTANSLITSLKRE